MADIKNIRIIYTIEMLDKLELDQKEQKARFMAREIMQVVTIVTTCFSLVYVLAAFIDAHRTSPMWFHVVIALMFWGVLVGLGMIPLLRYKCKR